MALDNMTPCLNCGVNTSNHTSLCSDDCYDAHRGDIVLFESTFNDEDSGCDDGYGRWEDCHSEFDEVPW